MNIEKEFAENSLLKSLGITIYGSVHEAKQKEIAEKKVCVVPFLTHNFHLLADICQIGRASETES